MFLVSSSLEERTLIVTVEGLQPEPFSSPWSWAMLWRRCNHTHGKRQSTTATACVIQLVTTRHPWVTSTLQGDRYSSHELMQSCFQTAVCAPPNQDTRLSLLLSPYQCKQPLPCGSHLSTVSDRWHMWQAYYSIQPAAWWLGFICTTQ